MTKNSGSVLVAYFSHTGQNYSNGQVIELKKGNTTVAAEMAVAFAGARSFALNPVKEYPYNYRECKKIAQQELQENARPKLSETVDVGAYDTVILGYPNWWGTMPMPVWTFLESQSFAGKTILPFCTHEGSAMGNSVRDLKKLCPNADIREGLAIHGSSVSAAKPAIEKWLNENLG